MQRLVVDLLRPAVHAARARDVDVPGRAGLDAREPQVVRAAFLQVEGDAVDRYAGAVRRDCGVAAPTAAPWGAERVDVDGDAQCVGAGVHPGERLRGWRA